MRTVHLASGDPARPTLFCLLGAMCTPLVFTQSAALSGMNAYALAWLEDQGPFDLQSIANRIAETINGKGDVVLIGHSLGAPLAVLSALALSKASQQPDLTIKGMVLSNSGANTKGHGDAAAIVQRIREKWGEPMWDAFVRRCFHAMPEGVLLEAVRGYPALLSSHAVAEAIQSQMETDLLPLLGDLAPMPIAVVHGEHDVARTLAHAEELAGAIHGATLHVLATGHTSCAENPLSFAAILREVANHVQR